MTVTGNGEIVAKPDYVQIQIEVRTEGKEVSAAQQENAVIMNRVIASLVALNIPREAIQTTAYTISPNYDYIEGRQVFRGYEVQNAITVKITDISQVGTVIDTAVENGANHVSAIQFKIDDSDAYYRQALQLALIDAQAKAKSMADTMHLPLQTVTDRNCRRDNCSTNRLQITSTKQRAVNYTNRTRNDNSECYCSS